MAAVVVQSRFAGLKIEDDDCPSSTGSRKTKKVKPIVETKKIEPPKKAKSATNKSQASAKKKKSKQTVCNPTAEQWETWKQKDEQLVDGNFESELHEAILLSKIDYEEKKDIYKQFKKEAELEKKVAEQPARSKKQKKKNVMSLDQFNERVAFGEDLRHNHEDEKEEETKLDSSTRDKEFFDRIESETKSVLLKDKNKDKVKNRQALSDEVISKIQFLDTLEKKDKEILSLREEIETLKQELLTVKVRNKKLCNILGQCEMRDKAEVMVEVERLRGVQTELTADLAALHSELERERSRNMDARPKDKKYPPKKEKRNIRFDVSSEAIVTNGLNSENN